MSLPDFLSALVGRAFPEDELLSAAPLNGGAYNQVYKVELERRGSVVLRVAPEPSSQLKLEQSLMRNELAAFTPLAPIESLMPKILFHDFSREAISSDYMFLQFLPGVTAGQGLPAFANTLPFWADFGSVLAQIHHVEGPAFGRVQGPLFDSWSGALGEVFAQMQWDLNSVDLPSNDIRTATMFLKRHAAAVDAVSVPRLLHGDLFLGNVLIDPDAAAPLIVGVLDSDRVSWGDPASDWTFHLLKKRSPAERSAFWDGYGGKPVADSASVIRDSFYKIRSLGESRLEFARLGLEEKAEATYPRLERELEKLIGLA